MKKFVSVQNSSTKIPGNIPKTDKNVQKGVENQNYQQKIFDQNIYEEVFKKKQVFNIFDGLRSDVCTLRYHKSGFQNGQNQRLN